MNTPATRPQPTVPVVDFTDQDALSPAQIEAFLTAGLLIIRGLVRGTKLAQLQAETLPMVDAARVRAAGMTELSGWLDPWDTA